ncbi:MAG: hypothetical protein K6F91_07545 [Ruminococcus sp.]|nr:hypothetical protein [Ruminococcus sp.]
MICPACGGNNLEGADKCVFCNAPLNGAPVNMQQPVQSAAPGYNTQAAPAYNYAAIAAEMFKYCSIDLEPKMSVAGIVIFAVLGAAILAVGIMLSLMPFILVGLGVGVVGSLIVFAACKTAQKEAVRTRNLFAADGEQFILQEFASAQSFANDQFRMSGFYIFARIKGVYRTVNITKITRVTEKTNFIPTGVHLDANIDDEFGSTVVTLCRLHLGKSKNEADDLFNEIVARKQFAYEQYSKNR